MTRDESHEWTRRRFLAGAVGTSAFAALPHHVNAAQNTPPSAGLSQAQALPAGAQDRINARLRLMRVALAQEPADLVIADGTLLDTLTGELLPGWGVAIAGNRIAAVGNVERHVGARTVRISAKGLTLVPG